MLRKYLPSIPPLLFALVFVNVLSSKSLHLLQHVQSLPVLYFVLYSPTLILWDLFVIFVSRVLLVWPETRLRWIPFLFGGFIACVILPRRSCYSDANCLDSSRGLQLPSSLASSSKPVRKWSGPRPIALFGIPRP